MPLGQASVPYEGQTGFCTASQLAQHLPDVALRPDAVWLCREGQYLDATGGSFRAFMEGKLNQFPGQPSALTFSGLTRCTFCIPIFVVTYCSLLCCNMPAALHFILTSCRHALLEVVA